MSQIQRFEILKDELFKLLKSVCCEILIIMVITRNFYLSGELVFLRAIRTLVSKCPVSTS